MISQAFEYVYIFQLLKYMCSVKESWRTLTVLPFHEVGACPFQRRFAIGWNEQPSAGNKHTWDWVGANYRTALLHKGVTAGKFLKA
jgi:hypothetical protein